MSLDTETRSVVMEREMKHPPEKVWRALTQGPLIEAWLMANDFAPVVGHKFTFRAKPMPQWNGIIDGEVLEVEPNQHLAYRWDSLGVETVVTWTLTRTANGTLVRMEQSGFRADQDNNFRGAQYGWQQFVAKLEAVLDQQ
ncbi:MAG: hypothetical protein JWM77_201 [Rhodospirillales bacterium]|jgi:uncharacterized protein YndB with AHSA1/START domain|nr:hypothetical protein [Rhodospirillales bacterium]